MAANVLKLFDCSNFNLQFAILNFSYRFFSDVHFCAADVCD